MRPVVLVDEALVQRVAALAKLTLSTDEAAYYQGQLQSILKYVDQLQDAPVGGNQSAHAQRSAPERQDEIVPSIDLDPVLNAAPLIAGTSFQVPRIIE